MARMIVGLFVLSICAWFSAACAQIAQQQTFELRVDSIPIADLGLEEQVPSAIDLVGPEQSAAGRSRAALIVRLRCWIDGNESCLMADKNDPRVRAIRRFLGQGQAERSGSVMVHFPDLTRVEVRLVRLVNAGRTDWDQSTYDAAVLTESVQAPGLR